MEFTKVIRSRRAIHHFDPNYKMPQKLFWEILESVRFTPSGYNAQPWKFLLFQEKEDLKKLQEIAFNQPHITQANSCIVALGDRDFGQNNTEEILENWKKYRNLPENKLAGLKSSLEKERTIEKKQEMVLRNGALAVMSFLLAAEDLGLATCPMMGFSQLKLKRFLNYPDHLIPLILIPIGKEHPTQKEAIQLPRKAAQEIGHIWTPNTKIW